MNKLIEALRECADVAWPEGDVARHLAELLEGGWKLVPVKPTEAMTDAWASLALKRMKNALEGVYPTGVNPIEAAEQNYRAMLAAAPDPMGDG